MTMNGKTTVVGQDVTVEEMLEIVERDRTYYERSGGGLTLSGGECLGQIDFARDLLRGAKENGINTAIESTGFADWEKIEQLVPYLDVYLMDIKHMNSQKHKEFTSQPNEKILENARNIAHNFKKLIIRTPIIPTFNDTK